MASPFDGISITQLPRADCLESLGFRSTRGRVWTLHRKNPGDPERPPVDLLRPYPAERMTAWEVGDRVGDVRNDDPELLAPRV